MKRSREEVDKPPVVSEPSSKRLQITCGGMGHKSTNCDHCDAVAYVKDVEAIFRDDRDTYKKFINILKDFKAQRISTRRVVEMVIELFKGHRKLLLGFNTFLPKGFEIVIPEIKKGVEFDKATQFVHKMKTRFQGDDHMCKSFIEILSMYQKEHKSITKLHQEVAALLHNHTDLFNEFTNYFADFSAAYNLKVYSSRTHKDISCFDEHHSGKIRGKKEKVRREDKVQHSQDKEFDNHANNKASHKRKFADNTLEDAVTKLYHQDMREQVVSHSASHDESLPSESLKADQDRDKDHENVEEDRCRKINGSKNASGFDQYDQPQVKKRVRFDEATQFVNKLETRVQWDTEVRQEVAAPLHSHADLINEFTNLNVNSSRNHKDIACHDVIADLSDPHHDNDLKVYGKKAKVRSEDGASGKHKSANNTIEDTITELFHQDMPEQVISHSASHDESLRSESLKEDQDRVKDHDNVEEDMCREINGSKNASGFDEDDEPLVKKGLRFDKATQFVDKMETRVQGDTEVRQEVATPLHSHADLINEFTNLKVNSSRTHKDIACHDVTADTSDPHHANDHKRSLQSESLKEDQDRDKDHENVEEDRCRKINGSKNASGFDEPQVKKGVRFDEATQFVDKMEMRFQGDDPHVYKSFLEILSMYRKKTKSVTEVRQEVAALLHNHTDLLNEFTNFFPDTSAASNFKLHSSGTHKDIVCHDVIADSADPHHDNNTLENTVTELFHRDMREQVTSHSASHDESLRGESLKEDQDRDKDHENVEEDRCRKINGSKNASGFDEDDQQQVKKHVRFDEATQFVDKMETRVQGDTEVRQEVTALLHNHTDLLNDTSATADASSRTHKDVACHDVIADSADPHHDNDLKVHEKKERKEDTELVHQDMREQVISHSASHDESLRSESLNCDKDDDNVKQDRCRKIIGSKNASVHEIDQSYCNQCTPSYRFLPDKDPISSTSHKTRIGAEVLNDHWVSINSGYSFKHMRKNSYEKRLFKCEDDRFELDMLIESVKATIRRVEILLDEIKNNSIGTDCVVRVEDHFTASNLRCIERLYGDNRLDVMDVLKKNASLALPFILTRLKQKEEQWARCRLGFNKVWAEIYAKNFHKSLDHRKT